ncbi:APC family permease [Sphingomonas bacterium]|uniref:APC family permease n=1 Tax=Sphingomonas bacterium TaxID=1895847 RepID=UPI0015757316|nr:APC family permease [Sphingomonas bacterium]
MASKTQAGATIGEVERDHGLVRGMGVIAFAATIANEVVGAGIYRLPAAMAAAAGVASPLAYLGCLVAMGAVVLCFAEGGSRVPTSGGPYGTIGAALGPTAGFVAGILLYLSCVLALGGVAAAFADTAAAALPMLSGGVPRATLIVVVLAAIAWLNVAGVETAARIIGWATFVKVLPLVLFVVIGGIALLQGQGAATPIAHRPGEGIGEAVILALFALSGMESPLAASGEVERPTRNIPRALLLAMGSIGLLYILIQLVAQGLLGAGLVGSKAPLADALGLVDPRLRPLMLVAASFSMLCWLASDLLGAPRLLFAFARDGLLPKALGRVHPRWKTPHVGIWIHALLAMALAVTGTFTRLAVFASLAAAALYFLGCAAAWVLRRRDVAILGEPLALPALPLIAIVGMASMLVIIGLGQWSEIAGLAAVSIASALVFLVLRRVRRT